MQATAIELIKAVIDSMIDNKFGRIVNITSIGEIAYPAIRAVKWCTLWADRLCCGVARQVAQHNVTINGLLQGSLILTVLKG